MLTDEFSNELTLARVDAYPIRAGGGVSPNMVLGQMPTRPGLLVRVTDVEGCEGWGEIWANFPPRANIHKAHVVEDVLAPKFSGIRFTQPAEVILELRRQFAIYFLHIGQERVFEHILAGIDTALWDLALRSAGQSITQFSGLDSAEASTYASSLNPPDLDSMLARHSAHGQTHFKLKIGFDDEADRAFVRRARDLLPLGATLMVDSNQTWDLKRAKSMLNSLEEFELGFAEEPMPANTDYGQWEALARSTSIPLAAGENVYGVDEFLRIADAGVRYVQPDVAKWGGVTGALELARQLPHGVQLWPHFLGTAVGQMASLAVSAVVGNSSTCEMDVNENKLRSDLCGDVYRIDRGNVRLSDQPGLVTPPVSDELSEFLDTGER